MFEDMTFELIIKRMLGRVSTDVDKREGSIIYDALAPAAAELALMYIELDTFLNEAFADTASREYLVRRAAERGLVPETATSAVLLAEVAPAGINVLGQRFNCGEYNYTLTAKLSDTTYRAECETAGAAPNGTFGVLIPIEYIQGLESARLVELLVPGEDEEDTEVFRARYMASLQSQAFGGNVADYKQKVLALAGVGGVKVYKAADWNGAGTVKLVIQDSEFGVPSSALVDDIQTAVDPIPNSGEGLGIAPIGHQVTVVGVNETELDITADITYAEGYDFEALKSLILAEVRDYLSELNKAWASGGITVFIMQLGARLLNIEGIVDIADIEINGQAQNFVLDRDSIIDISASTFEGEVLG